MKANMTRGVKIWPLVATLGGFAGIAALYSSIFTGTLSLLFPLIILMQ